VKFGLIAQMQAPRPWPDLENVDHRIHWDTLAEAVLAEEVGFDYYWATEHHFYEEIAHSSAPEVFLAVLAARTTRIRLGHGVVVLPCNHPVRVAERAATLDILSNGRLDLGTGRGASWYHTEAFGVSIERSREVWDEALRVICSLFVNDTFPGHKGRHYDIPERKLVPKPVQRPHPPLWVAAMSQATFAGAARAGLGVLGFTAVPPEELAPAVAAYRAAQAAADPADFFGASPNFQIAAFMTAHCDTDDRRGRALAGAAARWYLGDNEAPLNRVRFGPDFDRARFARYTDDALVRDRMVVGGDPDTCSRVIESWAEVGVDQLILMVQAGVTPHDEVMRAIELLGTKVLPRFQDSP
jgi:alkanesulfonate monooxygenase SsuD/methylene tetrahydromethanopterin reductase-like flavin-dependent oxidoreductase (luciferase family)